MKNFLFKPLSIKSDPSNVFVWSDLHLRHDRDFIWGPRGFSSVDEHDRVVIDRWESTLNNESTIIILGDIIFGKDAESHLEAFFRRVPFKTLYLMGGNHVSGFKQLLHKSDNNAQLKYGNKTVQFIPNYLEAYVDGKFYVMSHYAILSANGQGKDKFGGTIHGHSHSNIYKNEYGSKIYDGKIIDVGVENVQAPMSFKDLRVFLDKKENISYDHHTKATISPV